MTDAQIQANLTLLETFFNADQSQRSVPSLRRRCHINVNTNVLPCLPGPEKLTVPCGATDGLQSAGDNTAERWVV